MYRIAKLAELLNVSTVRIHEKLIACKQELAPHMHKENGVIALTEPGLLVLKHAFEEEKRSSARLPYLEVEADEGQTDAAAFPISDADRKELELLNLKDRLNQSRSELHRLNMESRRLDDALTHYMGLLKDDFDRRIREEDRLEGLFRLRRGGELTASQIGFFGHNERK